MDITEVDEATITKAIIKGSLQYLQNLAEADVIIVGAGPAGLNCFKISRQCGFKDDYF